MVFNRKSKTCAERRRSIQNRKLVGLFAVVVALMMCGARVAAQQSARIHQIGILSTNSGSVFSARVEAFRQRLRELGYVEGKNIVIEYRYADGKRERLPDLAAELARLKVDVIVTTGAVPVLAAKKASPTIPIVFASSSDPVRSGLVSSLAQPGGTITGLSQMAPDLDGKRLELLKEAFPKIVRVAFLWQAGGMRGNLELTDMEAAAKVLGIKLQSLPVRSLGDLEGAFARAKKERAQALITTTGALIDTQQRQVLDFAVKNRLPAMYPNSEFVEAGGLMSYGSDNTDLWWRAADFVDKILKGTKPADMPVEQATKFEFVVNMNAAKQSGLTIPQKVLARADRVIR
jgi:putative tryptophan/tyrosine transport system substrate-binding protein